MEEEVIKRKKMTFLFIIIGVALLSAAVTYVLITYVFNKKEDKIVYEKEEAKPIEGDSKLALVSDPVVLNLYNYVNISTGAADEFWSKISDMEINATTNMSDFDQYIKNGLASKFVLTEELSNIACNDDINALIKIETTNYLACGKIDSEDPENIIHSSNTTKIDETYLKKYVEKIFGPNSYKQSNFGNYHQGYAYYSPAKAYVYFEGIGGEFGETLLTSLEWAISENNTLTLKIKLYQEKTENQDAEDYGTYYFLYKIANNNYYLYSIKKVS